MPRRPPKQKNKSRKPPEILEFRHAALGARFEIYLPEGWKGTLPLSAGAKKFRRAPRKRRQRIARR